MAKPTLDQIFASNQQKPSLDNIFSQQPQVQTNPQQMAQQASQMPTGQIPVSPGLGYGMNTMSSVQANSMLGPEANKAAVMANISNLAKANAIPVEARQAAAVKQATIPAEIQGKAKGEELTAAQAQAKDSTIFGMLSDMMRKRNEDYADAHDSQLAGGKLQTMLGNAFGLKPLVGGVKLPYSNKGLEAAASFDAATNAMVSRGQQMFGEQVGTGAASTRIMATVVDLLKGEYGTREDDPTSIMGRTSGSTRSLYIMDKATRQYVKNLGDIDKKFTTPEQLDQLSQGLSHYVNNYQLTKQDEKNIQDRINYINQPLKRLVPDDSPNQSKTPSGVSFTYKKL